MKKRNVVISSILAGSILTISAVGLTHACSGADGRHSGGMQRGDKMMHMMKKLDLTEKQEKTISAIKDKQHEQMNVNKEAMKTIRKALHEQAKSNDFNESKVTELANAKAKIMVDMTIKRMETMNRIRKELTPEQIAKMDSFKERRFGRGLENKEGSHN